MTEDIHSEKILILDFGSQVTQLIARRVREQSVYSEIHPYNISLEKIREYTPKGIILSGGPSSVYDTDAPHSDPGIYNLGIPILGICYGMQLMTQQLGGKVERSEKREYGRASMALDDVSDLFSGFGERAEVWMSHGDRIEAMPDGFPPHRPYGALPGRCHEGREAAASTGSSSTPRWSTPRAARRCWAISSSPSATAGRPGPWPASSRPRSPRSAARWVTAR